MHIILKLLSGEVIERTVSSEVVTIGRSPKNMIQIPHDGMSRNHCQIELLNGEFFVTDLNSTNGVFIDGQRIETNKRVPYKTFLNLAFGAVQSAQVIMEDQRTSSHDISSLQNKTASERKTQSQGRPGKKTMLQTDPKEKPKPLSRPEQEERLKFWMNNLIVFAILAFAVYYYMTYEGEKVDYSNIRTDDSVEVAPISGNQ